MGLAILRRRKKIDREHTREQLEAEYTLYKFVNSPQSIGYTVDKPFDNLLDLCLEMADCRRREA